MKVSKLILALGLCSFASAQTEPLMKGNASFLGGELSFETRLEPATPPFSGNFIGGTVTDPGGIHRYMAYRALHKFFGYDLQVERRPLTDTYTVTIRALSISPAKLELDDPASWAIVALSGYPAPQVVRAGATIALDLFTNPNTGQKIVEYIHIQGPRRDAKAYVISPLDSLLINVRHWPAASGKQVVGSDGFIKLFPSGRIKAAGLTTPQLSAAIADHLAKNVQHDDVDVQIMELNQSLSNNARDLAPELVDVRLAAPRASLNGKDTSLTKESRNTASGPVVWFYLPDHGRYILSLVPHRNLGFIKAGEVQGSALTLRIDGDTIRLHCDGDIVPRGQVPYNLYVFHDVGWRPEDAAARDNLLLGSAESAERIVPWIDDKLRPRR